MLQRERDKKNNRGTGDRDDVNGIKINQYAKKSKSKLFFFC